MKKPSIVASVILMLMPIIASAHQPRIPDSNPTVIVNPEISKAYYSHLEGSPHTYVISSEEPFALYVNILAPDIAEQEKDISALIIKNGIIDQPVAILDGKNFEWTKFFEPFGYDSYWRGPEYKADVEAGEYQIIVHSNNQESKYSLAVGEKEMFNFKETINALNLIPQLKKDFFNESPVNFIFSPLGWGYILIIFILAFISGFLYRLILKRLAKNRIRKAHKNINKNDRILRLVLSIALLLLAITTSWNPILLFFSGFTLFEAIFSWCGFFAAIGKNTCPIN